MKNYKNKTKQFTIGQFNTGDWICFINSEGKKCIGILNELTVINKNAATVLDQYSAIEIVNYIDEDGISGSIKIVDFPETTQITSVNMPGLFERHDLNQVSKVTLKAFVLNINEINLN